MSSSLNLSSSSDPGTAPLAPLHDVVCTVDVVLGSAFLSVLDCLRLQRNSVVRLDQAAGADVKVDVNGVAVANGEVMIVEDSTAIRITEIVAPPSSGIVE